MFGSFFGSVAILGLSLVGCNRDGRPFLASESKVSEVPEASAAATPTEDVAVPSDAEVAGMVGAIDARAIEAARYAQSRSQNAAVRAFALRVSESHESIRRSVEELAQRGGFEPSSTERSRAFDQEWAVDKARLDAVEEGAFDLAFVESEAEAHRRAIEAFDLYVLPVVQEPEMKALVERGRASCQSHLDEAQRLRDDLRRASPGA
jgi:putative membrane protein